jgi:hypothetical protein
MNRQSIIVIIIGAVATLSGLAATDLLRKRRCGEFEGIWAAAVRECRLPSGEAVGTLTAGTAIIGLLIGVAVGFMLYRGYLYATGRAKRLASRQET